MRAFLKKNMPLLISGIVFGYNMPCSMSGFFLAGLSVIIVLLLCVKPSCNIPIYRKTGCLFIAIISGWMMEVSGFDIVKAFCMLEIQWKVCVVSISVYVTIVAIAMSYADYRFQQDANIRPQIKWRDKNLFLVREYDLERLKEMVFDEKVYTIGLEAEWGQGKSFLIEGLLEAMEDMKHKGKVAVDVIIIDVLAIRMDKFPEYIIGELDNVLYKNGHISTNMKKLKALFKDAKLNVLSNVWGDAEESYNKIFDDFRKEIIRLGKLVLIIYEDIDRLEDKKAVRDILYLTEKLTAANNKAYQGGVKVIYQYDRQHMENMGFSVRFLEKYIRRHMDLSVIDLITMIRKIQVRIKDTSKWKGFSKNFLLNEDEIMEFSFVRSELNYWFPEEKDWTDRYLSQGITVRRTMDFLMASFDRLKNENLNTKENRKCIFAFYFIQYFLPAAYQRIKEAKNPNCSLSSVFRITGDNGEEIYFMNLAKEIKERKQDIIKKNDNWIGSSYKFVEDDFLNKIDYKCNDSAFELFLAYRLLFSEENISPDKDSIRLSRKDWCESYAASVDEVYRKEGIAYVNTEILVRYLLQAGYASANSYVYWGNIIASEVLSCEDRSLWQEKFVGVLEKMDKNERGVETIIYIGRLVWAYIFRAFVFAGRAWGIQDNEKYFVRIIELYDMDRTVRNRTERFSQEFIDETLPLWEGLRGGESLCKFAQLIVRQEVFCNWNQYVNFYCYIRAALIAMSVNTYLAEYDFWILEDMVQEARDNNWEACMELAREELCKASLNLNRSHQILHKHIGEGFLPGEDERFKVLIKLVDYFNKVIDMQKDSSVRVGPLIHTEIHDTVAEAYSKLDAIEDYEEFKKRINDSCNDIGIANSIKLIDKHGKVEDL